MIKKKKKEKASDSLPLQGSSEVGSRDPKRSRFCQRFGGSWQLRDFKLRMCSQFPGDWREGNGHHAYSPCAVDFTILI